ncbi:MAG: HEPN domain-containing protein [Nanoarchaeota archaeon]|nr:HEPN domain-containing protein [Nanoarchaeota archaeon]
MDINDCFVQGLLRKDRPDIEKADKSIQRARHKLENASAAFDASIYEDAVINAYAAMFHAARALLFRDGVVEKSHFGVYVYIKEKYHAKLEARFINELNALRLERHELWYGLESTEVKEAEAEEVIGVAKEFIKAVDKLLQKP